MDFNMVRKVVRFADFFCRATIFIAFTFCPCLFKAVRLSTKAHFQPFRQLFASQYDRSNYLNAFFSLKEVVFAWLDEILFRHLMTANRLVDEWSHALDRTYHRHLDGDSPNYLRSIFEETVEAIPIPSFLRRILRGSFVDTSLVRFIKLQVHYSEVQYALTWVLYQMVYRPPLAFLYLTSNILNELSYYMVSPDRLKSPVRLQSRHSKTYGRPPSRRETTIEIAERVKRTLAALSRKVSINLPSPPESVLSDALSTAGNVDDDDDDNNNDKSNSSESSNNRGSSWSSWSSDDAPKKTPDHDKTDEDLKYFYDDLFNMEVYFTHQFNKLAEQE